MTFNVNFSALFLVVLMLFSGGISRAESTSPQYQGTEIAVFTPWSFFQKSLQNSLTANSNLQQNLGDLTLNLGGFDFHLSNVQFKLVAIFDQGQVTPQSYDVKAGHLDLALTIDKINLDQIVEQVIDGVLIRVHVQAECGALTMHQGSAQAQARIGFQLSSNDLTTQIENFDLQWPSQSWQVSPVSCRGPSGFNENLQNQLNQGLANADAVKPYLQNLIAQKIQTEVRNLLAKLKTPTTVPSGATGLPLVMNFKNFQTTANGIVNFGSLSWSGKTDESNLRPLSLENLPPNFSSDVPVLFTHQEALTDVLKAQASLGPVWKQLDLTKQSGFMRLLSSRFLQFFVWPDLFHYNKTSPFTLSISKPTALNVIWKNDGSAQVSLTTNAWVQSQRNNKWWNYIRLDGNASGQMIPAIQDGKLSLKAQVKSSGLKTAFGDDYVGLFKPTKRLATSLLQDFFNSAGQNLSTEINLPVLDLGSMGSAKPDSWKVLPQQGLISIPFKLQPSSAVGASGN